MYLKLVLQDTIKRNGLRYITYSTAIKVVTKGGCYLHPKITHNLVEEFRRLSLKEQLFKSREVEVRRPLHLLTRRECEVLQM